MVEDNVMAVGDGEGPVDGGVVGDAEGVGVHLSLSRCQLTPTHRTARADILVLEGVGEKQTSQRQSASLPADRRGEGVVGVVGVNMSTSAPFAP